MDLNWGQRNGMNGAQDNRTLMNQPTNTSMDSTLLSSEDALGDADEPPDEQAQCTPRPASAQPRYRPSEFDKSYFQCHKKTSLLTQALHTSDDDSQEDTPQGSNIMTRGVSVASTWSQTSAASTAELTSDGGLTSPGTRTSSPSPPPPTTIGRLPTLLGKPFQGPVQIARDDGENVPTVQKPVTKSDEATLEADLGRKRCITFACGRRDTPKAKSASPPKPAEDKPQEPPPRRCALRFICPSRQPSIDVPEEPKPRRGRLLSPPPAIRRQITPRGQNRAHRDSDSTVRNESPRSVRKAAPVLSSRQSSANSDLGRHEATRFHEFASSEEEIDEWVQDPTCHSNRITVDDTLRIENGLRRLGQEAEEEAIQEEEDEDDLDNNNEDDDDVDDTDEAGSVSDSLDDVSDDGFQTDDEDGFASSDDDSDAGSDYQWWAPVRPAKHAEHIRPAGDRSISESSIGSAGSLAGSLEKRPLRTTRPVKIRPSTPELPDSTDFVCGTLDEDRPLENAYISCIEQRRVAKHKVTPQDIDPTFPQSDPEMEEDDRDKGDDSDHVFMHGRPDSHDEDGSTPGRGRPTFNDPFKKSPHPSPKRLRSPPPPSRRSTVTCHRSPPPPSRRHRSPPPPRRLFGNQSPRRLTSPPPAGRLRSPPPTRHTSVAVASNARTPAVLAARPNAITHSKSLPRPSSGFPLALSAHLPVTDDDDDTPNAAEGPVSAATPHTARARLPRGRGAIDIVKGLEKKRALRKEKMLAKQCRKPHREKKPLVPGRGAERMRSIGIEAHNAKKGVEQPLWSGKGGFVISC